MIIIREDSGAGARECVDIIRSTFVQFFIFIPPSSSCVIKVSMVQTRVCAKYFFSWNLHSMASFLSKICNVVKGTLKFLTNFFFSTCESKLWTYEWIFFSHSRLVNPRLLFAGNSQSHRKSSIIKLFDAHVTCILSSIII